jgi:hypothetical protein
MHACVPVQLDSENKSGRVGMCRDGSESGVLIGTPSSFAVGECVTMTFRSSDGAELRSVTGRVVRLSACGSAGWLSRLVAVEFDEPMGELVERIRSEGTEPPPSTH